MGGVAKREQAKRDLVEQFVWYGENAGIEVAERFLSAVEATLTWLSSTPDIGSPIRSRNNDLQGLRRWPVEGFEALLLFYFPIEGGIDLVRVLHAKRDWQGLFRKAI